MHVQSCDGDDQCWSEVMHWKFGHFREIELYTTCISEWGDDFVM